MANIIKDGYIKTQAANGDIVTVYPYTKAGNVDGLDVFGASGSNHSTGLVPDPGETAGTSKYLREDGTWAEPAGGGGGSGAVYTVYIGSTEYAPDANGKVTLPSYPTSLPASDVYSWAKASSKPSYTYSEVGAASSGHTHSNATTSSSGFMSYSDKSKLNGIDSGANYYTHPTSAGNKHIPSGGATDQFLKYAGSSGTAEWMYMPIKCVYTVSSNSAIARSYQMSTSDFIGTSTENSKCGTYIITNVSWGTSPKFSMYAVSYSGGVLSYKNITKIAGEDINVNVDTNNNITCTVSGKLCIYALRTS